MCGFSIIQWRRQFGLQHNQFVTRTILVCGAKQKGRWRLFDMRVPASKKPVVGRLFNGKERNKYAGLRAVVVIGGAYQTTSPDLRARIIPFRSLWSIMLFVGPHTAIGLIRSITGLSFDDKP